MDVESEKKGEAETGAARSDDASLGAALDAGADLFAALRRVATAIKALLVAEARVFGASIATVFVGGVALVACAVSLWACVVALIGWALTIATGSIGIALGVLIALHLILVAGLWLWIMRAIRSAGFPATRAELRALGGELRRDVARFQSARPSDSAPSVAKAEP